MYVQGVGLGAVGVIDHIPAQNQAGADLAAVVTEWQNAKNAGTLYQSVAQNFATRLRYIGDTFAAFARNLHNSRADAGAKQIQDLANSLAAGVMKDVQPMPVGVVAPVQQQVIDAPVNYTGQPTGIVGTIQTVIHDVVHDVQQAIDPGAPVDPYGQQQGFQQQGLPSWALPAAAVAAVWFFMRK